MTKDKFLKKHAPAFMDARRRFMKNFKEQTIRLLENDPWRINSQVEGEATGQRHPFIQIAKENDPDLRKTMAFWLEELGYKVSWSAGLDKPEILIFDPLSLALVEDYFVKENFEPLMFKESLKKA